MIFLRILLKFWPYLKSFLGDFSQGFLMLLALLKSLLGDFSTNFFQFLALLKGFFGDFSSFGLT